MKPIFLLTVDEAETNAIALIVRISDQGITIGQIRLPDWQELPASFDVGIHQDRTAPGHLLCRDIWIYAFSIDIESSQLWNAEWVTLQAAPDIIAVRQPDASRGKARVAHLELVECLRLCWPAHREMSNVGDKLVS